MDGLVVEDSRTRSVKKDVCEKIVSRMVRKLEVERWGQEIFWEECDLGKDCQDGVKDGLEVGYSILVG